MRRLSLILCVLLACVASAMAADWYEVNAASWELENGEHGVYHGYNYNPDPLQADIDSWWDVIYQPPFDAGITFGTPPWYEYVGEAALTPGPGGPLDLSAYEIRQNLITLPYYLGNSEIGDMSIGTLHVADSWWPNNYSIFQNGWTNQKVLQGDWKPGGDVHIGKVNFGHDQSEFELPEPCNNFVWEFRNGKGPTTLTVDEWHVLSSATTVTEPTNKGVNYGIVTTGWVTRPEWGGGHPDTISVTMGDIYLNAHPMVFECGAGVWNITGDVGLEPNALDGNFVFLMTGDVDSYTETVQTGYGSLNIQESVLDKMIAEGYFWIRGGNYYDRIWPYIDRNREIDINVTDPADNGGKYIPDYYATYRQITPATKDHWLKINDNGDGTVNVHVVGYHYQDQYKEYAWSPNYPNGAWGVQDPNIVLEWSAGVGADLHDVYFGKALRADLNKSGTVDIEDLSILVDHWLAPGSSYTDPNGVADPNSAPNAANIAEPNDICDLADFAVMAEEWGQDCLELIGTTTAAVTSLDLKNETTVETPLERDVTYIWRVDEVDTDTIPETIYTGRVWNFRLNEYDENVPVVDYWINNRPPDWPTTP